VEFEVHDVIEAADRVAVRLTSRAQQTGSFMGMPATGKRYEIEEIHIFRVADGRIAEHWHQGDMLGMMRQLGLLPGRG
jgi:predicted ester cyclase